MGTICGGGENVDQITLKFPFQRLDSVPLGESLHSLSLCAHISVSIPDTVAPGPALRFSDTSLLSTPLPPELIPQNDSSPSHGSVSFHVHQVGGRGRKSKSQHFSKSVRDENFPSEKLKTVLKSRQLARVSSKITSQPPTAHY